MFVPSCGFPGFLAKSDGEAEGVVDIQPEDDAHPLPPRGFLAVVERQQPTDFLLRMTTAKADTEQSEIRKLPGSGAAVGVRRTACVLPEASTA